MTLELAALVQRKLFPDLALNFKPHAQPLLDSWHAPDGTTEQNLFTMQRSTRNSKIALKPSTQHFLFLLNALGFSTCSDGLYYNVLLHANVKYLPHPGLTQKV